MGFECLPIPQNDKTMNIICGILEIFPGVGLLVACAVNNCNKDLLITGLLQLVCTLIIFGWIWSVINGIMIIIKSC
ncbi:Transmembrane domain-containing protein [Spironucleus salmonicida]|uniref:Transmembrane domain-containing protein n=1 Tax=Spironucleus salmonicida TaxID=348837 RepID=V6LXC5_9EUKA|nr:Transmembrane domain-containing protein [Spironucleus salmonicida]|eukprot:EST45474.1 Transmembrane domain-containing protein [Spironucleus salmonicida]